jgi:hypothetical protein
MLTKSILSSKVLEAASLLSLLLTFTLLPSTGGAQNSTWRLWGPESELLEIDVEFPVGASAPSLSNFLELYSFKTYERKEDGWYWDKYRVPVPLEVQRNVEDVGTLCSSQPCTVFYSSGFSKPLLSKITGKHVYRVFWAREGDKIVGIFQRNSLWAGDK